MAALSTQTFEQPKSLFEEQMQRQAIQLRQRAVRQSLHEPSVSMAESQQHNQQDRDVVMRRRSSATEGNPKERQGKLRVDFCTLSRSHGSATICCADTKTEAARTERTAIADQHRVGQQVND